MNTEEIMALRHGADKLDTYKTIKIDYMRLAHEARKLIAHDLGVELPSSGKQHITTALGTYRIAMKHNSDNSTERAWHYANDVTVVDLSVHGSPGVLYQAHGLPFNEDDFKRRLADRLK